MEPIKIITESDLSYFIKPKTVDDVESHMDTLILIRKHIDMDNKVSKKYFLRLYDNPSENSTSYKVLSNAIGLEAIRNIIIKHKIYDGGSESENSTYISFYSE